MTVAVIGQGLIGGSMAKAIKLNTENTVLGYDLDEKVMCRALLVGAIDGRLRKEDVKDCSLVIFALFPNQTVKSIKEYAPYINKNATVIDTCGTKRMVCREISKIAHEYGFMFVGAHPMAGREKIGFSASLHNLFDNASILLTPNGKFDIEKLDRLKKFLLSLGFSKVVLTDTDTHDEMISYTSQLAHIVSSAYIKNPLSCKAKGFSAGSFRDMTRVATLNETMWTELFLENRDYLSEQTGFLIEKLEEYKKALDDNDDKTLFALLKEGREAKEISEESMKD